MPLSEQEQALLDQLEATLAAEDPRLAATLTTGSARGVGRWVVAGVCVVLGIAGLVAGVALGWWWLSVLGFVVMFAGVAFALLAPPAASVPGGAATGGVSAEDFMDKLEDRWNRRMGGGL
jgi:hypothetical protein